MESDLASSFHIRGSDQNKDNKSSTSWKTSKNSGSAKQPNFGGNSSQNMQDKTSDALSFISDNYENVSQKLQTDSSKATPPKPKIQTDSNNSSIRTIIPRESQGSEPRISNITSIKASIDANLFVDKQQNEYVERGISFQQKQENKIPAVFSEQKLSSGSSENWKTAQIVPDKTSQQAQKILSKYNKPQKFNEKETSMISSSSLNSKSIKSQSVKVLDPKQKLQQEEPSEPPSPSLFQRKGYRPILLNGTNSSSAQDDFKKRRLSRKSTRFMDDLEPSKRDSAPLSSSKSPSPLLSVPLKENDMYQYDPKALAKRTLSIRHNDIKIAKGIISATPTPTSKLISYAQAEESKLQNNSKSISPPPGKLIISQGKVMVVKGPAGGYSNSSRVSTSINQQFYQRQGTVSKPASVRKQSQSDSSIHTDDSWEKEKLTTQRSRAQDVSEFNRQRSKRISDKQINFNNKKLKTQQTIQKVLSQRSYNQKVVKQQTSKSTAKSAAEMVQDFVAFKPGKEFEIIKGKDSSLMNQQELELEQVLLTQELNHISKYLSRIIDKEFIAKQVLEGKERGSRKGITKTTLSLISQGVLLDQQIRNCKKQQKTLKREQKELQSQFQHLMDPDLAEKIRFKLEYLEEMIKGECVNISKLNSKNLRLRTVDFGKGEVKSEKHMVEIEDELMKVKSKIGKFTHKNRITQQKEIQIDEKILENLQLEEKLNAKLKFYENDPVVTIDQKLQDNCKKLKNDIEYIKKLMQACQLVKNTKQTRYDQSIASKQITEAQNESKLAKLDQNILMQTQMIAELRENIIMNRQKGQKLVLKEVPVLIVQKKKSLMEFEDMQLLSVDKVVSEKLTNTMVSLDSALQLLNFTGQELSLKSPRPLSQLDESRQNIIVKMSLNGFGATNKLADKLIFGEIQDVNNATQEEISRKSRSLKKFEIRELQQLTRKFAKPLNQTVKRDKQKVHELVDDAESTPRTLSQTMSQANGFFNRRSLSRQRKD